jgi:hypothetical protein
MNNKQNLEITKILEEKGEYSKVTISNALFTMIKQSNWAYTNKVNPVLMFLSRKNAAGKYLKIFKLNNVDLYVYQHKIEDVDAETGEKNVNTFFVKTSDITPAIMVEEPTVDLDVDMFSEVA